MSPPITPIQSPRQLDSAFTLVELLAVISIFLVLTGLAVTSFTGGRSGRDLTRAIVETSEVIDLARARATTMNTYVYVVIDTSRTDEVNLLILESTTGVDVLDGQSTTAVASNADIALVQPMIHLSGVGFRDAGNTYKPPITSLSDTTADALSSQINVEYQRAGETFNFDRVITFLPSGQVRNGSAFTSELEFGFQEQKQNVELDNPAAIRVSGLTGRVHILRPQP